MLKAEDKKEEKEQSLGDVFLQSYEKCEYTGCLIWTPPSCFYIQFFSRFLFSDAVLGLPHSFLLCKLGIFALALEQTLPPGWHSNNYGDCMVCNGMLSHMSTWSCRDGDHSQHGNEEGGNTRGRGHLLVRRLPAD